ncbi:MAG: hypothetical protein IJN92_08760 [Lachnospiraceae bacterium]|nr:hypothetical protein [Lachnospiraceae bacterium]
MTVKTTWEYLEKPPEADNNIITPLLAGIYQAIYNSMFYIAPAMLLVTIISIILASTSEALREGKRNLETGVLILIIAASCIYWLNLILAVVLSFVGII